MYSNKVVKLISIFHKFSNFVKALFLAIFAKFSIFQNNATIIFKGSLKIFMVKVLIMPVSL